MKDEYLEIAMKKYPLPAMRFKDNPSQEWLIQRAINIFNYAKELSAAQSANINFH